MKDIVEYITEKFKINSSTDYQIEKPENKYKLIAIIKERCTEDDILYLNDINIANIDNLSWIFDCKEAKSITKIDISSWDFSKVKTIHGMFKNLNNLKEIVFPDKINLLNCKDMSQLFIGCTNLTKLNINDWNVKNVENISGMFCRCNKISNLDLSKWDIGNVKKMNNTFKECESLSNANFVNLDVWNVNTNIVQTNGMFDGCKEEIFPKWYIDK